MKTYTVTLTEEFLMQAHEAACPKWKEKIENLVPEAFNVHECADQFYNKETGETYILAQVRACEICLISLTNGNRFVEPMPVKDSRRITDDELSACMGTKGGSETFIKVKKTKKEHE